MKTSAEAGKGTTFNNPIDLLLHDHEKGMVQLSLLEQAAESIRVNGFSPEAFEQIAATIRWMNTEVRKHTEIEERLVFPLVESHMKSLAEQVRGEHRDLWDAFSDLLAAVKEVEEGRLHGTSIRNVVSIAEMIVELMRTHIRRENTILFPAIRQLLSNKERQDLLEAIQKSL
jgi:hemerythrin-like domain-containing protein